MLVLKMGSHCPSSSSFKNSVSHLQPSQTASNPISFPYSHLLVAFHFPKKIKAVRKEPPLYVQGILQEMQVFCMYFISYFYILPMKREIVRGSKRRQNLDLSEYCLFCSFEFGSTGVFCIIKTPSCTNLIKLNEPHYMPKWKHNHMEKLF